MVATVINIIIALIVIGVLLWAVRKLIDVIPMEGWIKQIIDVIIIVAVVLVIVFYVVLPLISMVAGGIHMPSIR